jgi:hypothetical protein
MNLQDIQDTIAKKSRGSKMQSNTAFVAFNGGAKDFHITDTFTFEQTRGY